MNNSKEKVVKGPIINQDLYKDDIKKMNEEISFAESRLDFILGDNSLYSCEHKEKIKEFLNKMKNFLSDSNARETYLFFSQGGERLLSFNSLIQSLKLKSENAENNKDKDLNNATKEVLETLEIINTFIENYRKDVTQTH